MENKSTHSFTVDRSKWLRGYGGQCSSLNATGRRYNGMCCLGFLAISCGFSEEEIENAVSPEDVSSDKGGLWPPGILSQAGNNTDICLELMRFNDTGSLDDSYREEVLRNTFKEIGIEVSFVDSIETQISD